jgi:hypothetical protein
MPLEDIGVKPDSRHALSREDLLNGNIDLINRAGQILTTMDTFDLDADVTVIAGGLRIAATTLGLDRIDVYVDDRPIDSINVADGAHGIDIVSGGNVLRLKGFDGGKLVASQRIDL